MDIDMAVLLMTGNVFGHCFPGTKSCYLFLPEKKCYVEEAARECAQHDAELVSIETQAEMDHLESVIREDDNLQVKDEWRTPEWIGYWTSGVDEGENGTWVWEATNQKFGFTHWGWNQPDHLLVGEKHVFIEMRWLRWWDVRASLEGAAVLCEKKVECVDQ